MPSEDTCTYSKKALNVPLLFGAYRGIPPETSGIPLLALFKVDRILRCVPARDWDAFGRHAKKPADMQEWPSEMQKL